MSNEIERNESAEVDEAAEAVLPLQETPAEESDVEAHGSTVSLAACAGVEA